MSPLPPLLWRKYLEMAVMQKRRLRHKSCLFPKRQQKPKKTAVAIRAVFLLLPISLLIYDGLAIRAEGQSVSLPFTRALAITSRSLEGRPFGHFACHFPSHP